MHYFEHRTGRAVSRREAFEADGRTLRDGISIRVRMSATDAAPRFADGRSFWDAHRDSLVVVDPRRVGGGTQGSAPGYRVFDSDVGREERAAAYAEHEAYLRDAWRNPPPRDAGFGSPVGDAKKKEDPPEVTGRSRCPECDGRGVVHGKTCQACGGDGWVDDDENDEDDDNGEKTATSDRRMLDVQAVSRAHQRKMAKIYQQINGDVSQRWRER